MLLLEFIDRGEASFDRRAQYQGPQQPLAEQPASHGSDGTVQDA